MRGIECQKALSPMRRVYTMLVRVWLPMARANRISRLGAQMCDLNAAQKTNSAQNHSL